MRRKLWLGLLATLAALALAAVAAVDWYGLTDRAQPADAIVIMGSQVRASGRPGPALVRRTHWAAELYRRGLAPRLICSGGLGGYPPSEAQAACDLAQSLGVPAEAVILETQARSTEETSLYVADILRGRGWRSAVVVSDGYHLARTVMLFSRAGVTAYPSPAQGWSGPMAPAERAVRGAREVVAIAWYWLKTALGLPITDVQ